MSHVEHLKFEIECLSRMLKEYDTGHVKTAIQVLEHRIKELQDSENGSLLDSSYPDGDGYWKT